MAQPRVAAGGRIVARIGGIDAIDLVLGHQQHVGVRQPAMAIATRGGEIDDAERRDEPCRFVEPVVHEASRHDDYRRAPPALAEVTTPGQ